MNPFARLRGKGVSGKLDPTRVSALAGRTAGCGTLSRFSDLDKSPLNGGEPAQDL
jgi:hypothetical protein